MQEQRAIQSTSETVQIQRASAKISASRYEFPEYLIFTSMLVTIFIILFMSYYIISEALPTFQREGLSYITGTIWSYDTNQYGILYFIAGTIYLTIATLIIAVPLSVLTAIYLAEFAPAWLMNILRPMIELLVGIPSIVYGYFGWIILGPVFRDYIKTPLGNLLGFTPIFKNTYPDTVNSILLASTILAIMILPTIVVISIEALRSVPREYREASIAIGATRWETMTKVMIPVSISGIMTGILLGAMRAMGETMAVVMLLGNNLMMPVSVLDRGYAMTSKILNDILYYLSNDQARSALMGIVFVLFIIEFGLLVITKAVSVKFK